MKKLIALTALVLSPSLSFAIACTNQDISAALNAKLIELKVSPDQAPCDLSKKSVDFNTFAITLITVSCPANPDINAIVAKYEAVKNEAEGLVVQYCGH